MTKDEIQDLIGDDQLLEAIEAMIEMANDTKHENTVRMLKNQYRGLERQTRMGVLSFADGNMKRNQIAATALDMLGSLKEISVPAAVAPPTPPPHSGVPTATAADSGGAAGGERRAKKLFISYAREDYAYVERLKAFLYPLQKQGLVSTWSDSNLTAGQEWNDAIRKEMEEADIILYMVSINFLTSSFIGKYERPWANDHAASKNTIIVPVIVRPCPWNDEGFSRYNAIPKDDDGRLKPLSQWPDQDEAMTKLVKQLKGIIKD